MPYAPLPFPLNLGPFTAAEAAAAGVSWRRLRRTDVAHPHRGVYVPLSDHSSTLADVVDRCEGALPVLGEHRWFSHLTAARIWGIPLPSHSTSEEPLHILTLPGAEPIRRRGLVGWESGRADVERLMIGLIPVIAPAEVWCQLAMPGAVGRDGEWFEEVSVPRVAGRRRRLPVDGPTCQRWTTAALHPRRPCCRAGAPSGKRGAKALSWAIERVRTPVHSPRETFLRLALVRWGLPEPQVQVPVLTADGVRHADLGYPEARLLIEYQGDQHRTDRRQWLDDLTRRQLFEDAGYRVIAVGALDLDDEGFALAQRIGRALRGRPFGG